MKLLVYTLIWIFAELVTIYLGSLVWLAEGQPNWDGHPLLHLLAWICIGMIVLEFLCYIAAVVRLIMVRR